MYAAGQPPIHEGKRSHGKLLFTLRYDNALCTDIHQARGYNTKCPPCNSDGDTRVPFGQPARRRLYEENNRVLNNTGGTGFRLTDAFWETHTPPHRVFSPLALEEEHLSRFLHVGDEVQHAVGVSPDEKREIKSANIGGLGKMKRWGLISGGILKKGLSGDPRIVMPGTAFPQHQNAGRVPIGIRHSSVIHCGVSDSRGASSSPRVVIYLEHSSFKDRVLFPASRSRTNDTPRRSCSVQTCGSRMRLQPITRSSFMYVTGQMPTLHASQVRPHSLPPELPI